VYLQPWNARQSLEDPLERGQSLLVLEAGLQEIEQHVGRISRECPRRLGCPAHLAGGSALSLRLVDHRLAQLVRLSELVHLLVRERFPECPSDRFDDLASPRAVDPHALLREAICHHRGDEMNVAAEHRRQV
jgi:hypothetical protein